MITTFFLCLFTVRVSFVLYRKQELSIIELAFSFTLLILILSALLLRINKLLKRINQVTDDIINKKPDLVILIDSPDYEWLMIDATHCKVHPHGS